MSELTYDQQVEITRILEGFRANPSNSNKYRYDLFAYINDLLAHPEKAQPNEKRKK